MATVPGTPINDDAYGGIPKELRPTQADLMIAAAMHAQQQQEQPTNNVVQFQKGNGRVAQQNEKFPDIDYEEELKDQRMNVKTRKEGDEVFDNLYKQLESLKGKVKPGNVLRLYDKSGNDFYYQRDDDFEHGFGWHPKPPDKVS